MIYSESLLFSLLLIATQKLPPFVYQFYPYPNYSHILGYKVTCYGMAWNWRATIFGLWRCAVWLGHYSGNVLENEVTPTQPLLWTWLALAMTFFRYEK